MSFHGGEQSTATCNRFEEEDLLLQEQGLPLDEHFATCASCSATQAEYAWLRAGLSALDRESTGRSDWQARIWAGVTRRQSRRRWQKLWWAAAPLAVAAAALLVVGHLGVASSDAPAPRGAGGDVLPSLAYTIHPTSQNTGPMRGDHAKPGDTLAIEIDTGSAAYAELRVYRDDSDLIVRCDDEPPCNRRGRVITASVVLDARGHYQIAFLHGERPLPAPAPALDRDLAEARAGGATVDLREIDVL